MPLTCRPDHRLVTIHDLLSRSTVTSKENERVIEAILNHVTLPSVNGFVESGRWVLDGNGVQIINAVAHFKSSGGYDLLSRTQQRHFDEAGIKVNQYRHQEDFDYATSLSF